MVGQAIITLQIKIQKATVRRKNVVDPFDPFGDAQGKLCSGHIFVFGCERF
jgi:hypothetical protein